MCRGTKQSLTVKTVAILLDVTTHVIMSLAKSDFFLHIITVILKWSEHKIILPSHASKIMENSS